MKNPSLNVLPSVVAAFLLSGGIRCEAPEVSDATEEVAGKVQHSIYPESHFLPDETRPLERPDYLSLTEEEFLKVSQEGTQHWIEEVLGRALPGLKGRDFDQEKMIHLLIRLYESYGSFDSSGQIKQMLESPGGKGRKMDLSELTNELNEFLLAAGYYLRTL